MGTWEVRAIAIDQRGNEVESSPFLIDVATASAGGSVECQLTTIELDGRMRCRALPTAGSNPVEAVTFHFSNGVSSGPYTSNLEQWRTFGGFDATGDFDVVAELRDSEDEIGFTSATDYSVVFPDFNLSCDSPVEINEGLSCSMTSPLGVLTSPGSFTLEWDREGGGAVSIFSRDPGAGYTVPFAHTVNYGAGYSSAGEKVVRLTFGEHGIERSSTVTVTGAGAPDFSMPCTPSSIDAGETVACTGTSSVPPDQIVWLRRHAHNSAYSTISTDTSGNTTSNFSTSLLNNNGGTANAGVRAIASFSGESDITRTRLIEVTSTDPGDEIDVSVNCSPTTISSGGTVNCTAALSDNPDEVRWQVQDIIGVYVVRATNTSGNTSSSFSWDGFENTGSSQITRRVRARAYLGSATDDSEVPIQINPEPSGAVPSSTCSVSPLTPVQGSPASLEINFDGNGSTVTGISWTISGANSGSGSTNPNSGSGLHTTSAPTGSSGSTNVEVTVTNSEGSSTEYCAYNVEEIDDLDVSLSCSMTGSGNYTVGESATMSCTATSNLTGSSFSFSGGGCQGASGSGTSASCGYGALDTSTDGSFTAPVTVQVTHGTAGNSPASASQTNPYDVDPAAQVWSCSMTSPSPQGFLGGGDGWATGSAINTATHIGFTARLECPSCDLTSLPSYVSSMGAGSHSWRRIEGSVTAAGGGSFSESGGIWGTDPEYYMEINVPEPNPGDTDDVTYTLNLSGPNGDTWGQWGTGSLSATVLCSWQDP